jgi:site-specific DNA-methyltransferase (adenine-specific)
MRLLGIKIRKNKAAAAMAFLEKKTKSQAVYVRFDQNSADGEGNWLGYLYLKNRTFLNAHLIKAGFAVPDRQEKFRYLDRFIKYQQEVEVSGPPMRI